MEPLTRYQANAFFDLCDTSGDNRISIQELVAQIAGDDPDRIRDVVKMFSDVDKNCDLTITREEFINEVCAKPRQHAIEELFAEADTDNSKSISTDELDDLLKKKGKILDQETVQEIFSAVDKDGSGSISLSEFKAAMDEQY